MKPKFVGGYVVENGFKEPFIYYLPQVKIVIKEMARIIKVMIIAP